MKMVFAIVCWAVIFLASAFFGFWWSESHPFLWSFAVWAIATAFSVNSFLVSVPEVTGLLTINLLVGKSNSPESRLYPYGPGIHFRFPWEQVKKENFINLRLVTGHVEEDYPAKNGPKMHVKWLYQYQPMLGRLAHYIAVDQTTIDTGIKGVGSSVLSADIATMDADEVKKDHHKIEVDLVEKFESMTPTPEELYGIDLVRVAMEDVDYEPRYQEVRSSELIAVKLGQIADDIIKKHPKVSQKDAMNIALIVNKNVTKTVTEVEGEGGEALAALLIAMAKGGK